MIWRKTYKNLDRELAKSSFSTLIVMPQYYYIAFNKNNTGGVAFYSGFGCRGGVSRVQNSFLFRISIRSKMLFIPFWSSHRKKSLRIQIRNKKQNTHVMPEKHLKITLSEIRNKKLFWTHKTPPRQPNPE